jgi:hypothetical protein
LKNEFPDDESLQISHEAIYQALYVESRGALKRELVTCLRRGRALRVPRARSRQKAWAHVTPETLISQRPPEAADRAVPGHWEGDLLIGLQRSAIGTLVERSSRFTMLIHLPREDGYGLIPRTKNGPALAGYGALTMAGALAQTITTLPEQLRRSLTWIAARNCRHMPSSQSPPVSRCTSLTRRARGSSAPTKTPTVFYANTFRKAPTYPAGTPTTSLRSPTPSTPDPAKPWDGAPPPKPSTTIYTRQIKPVLRPPIESSYLSSGAFSLYS